MDLMTYELYRFPPNVTDSSFFSRLEEIEGFFFTSKNFLQIVSDKWVCGKHTA